VADFGLNCFPFIDDFHYPTLTVRQTLEMALKTKTPSKRLQNHRKEFVSEFLDVLTKMYGLTKQVETVVGNAFIRGISGGERKRLSIAEQMATRSSVNMWDGSTRGLDASSALDYAKSLRVQTNLLKKATIVTIYQAVSNVPLFCRDIEFCLLFFKARLLINLLLLFHLISSLRTSTTSLTRPSSSTRVAPSTLGPPTRLVSTSYTLVLSALPVRPLLIS